MELVRNTLADMTMVRATADKTIYQESEVVTMSIFTISTQQSTGVDMLTILR